MQDLVFMIFGLVALSGQLATATESIWQRKKRAVTAGDKRLHLNTTYKPVSKAPGSTSLDDTTSLGLTDAAERDYFRLRKRIETSNKQIAGLQEYIRKQYVK